MEGSGEVDAGSDVDVGINSSSPEIPDRVLYAIQLWFTPVLVTLGSVGNCLSVIVFFGTKLKKLSSSYYLSALAVSDTCCLIALAASWLDFIDISLFNKEGFCQLFVYIKYVCSFLSVWFVVAFTVERFVAVNYPLQRLSMCTVARARAVLAFLTTLGLATFSPYLFMAGTVPHPAPDAPPSSNRTVLVCTLVSHWHTLAKLLNYADLCLTLILPVILILTLNASIARTVFKLARARNNLTNQPPPHLNGHAGAMSVAGAGARARARRRTARSVLPRSSTTQTKVTEMLLVVSTVFIALNLPSYIIRLWIFLNETIQNDMQVIILQHYFNILFEANFGINFVLYCVSGQNFRSALITMCGRPPSRRTDHAQLTVVSECRHSGSLCRNRTVTVTSWRDGRDDARATRDSHQLLPLSNKVDREWSNGCALEVDTSVSLRRNEEQAGRAGEPSPA